MEIITLVICIVTLCLSVGCLFLVLSLYSKLGKLSDGKNTEKKLEDMKESIYNEFSRNRSEQNAISQAQYDKSLGDLRDMMAMHGVE